MRSTAAGAIWAKWLNTASKLQNQDKFFGQWGESSKNAPLGENIYLLHPFFPIANISISPCQLFKNWLSTELQRCYSKFYSTSVFFVQYYIFLKHQQDLFLFNFFLKLDFDIIVIKSTQLPQVSSPIVPFMVGSTLEKLFPPLLDSRVKNFKFAPPLPLKLKQHCCTLPTKNFLYWFYAAENTLQYCFEQYCAIPYIQ